MAWQLARNLSALRDEIKKHLPGVTIYTIGDTAHQQRPSDHNPDDTSGSRATQSDSDSLQEVRAIDIMLNVSDLSMKIVNALVDPRSRGRLKYVIHGGKIWSASNNWVVKPFTSDPHNDHIHVSGRAGDDSNGAGWPAVAEIWEEPVTPDDVAQIKAAILGDGGMQMLFTRVEALSSGRDPHTGKQPNVLHQRLLAVANAVGQIDAKVAAKLKADLDEIDAGIAAARAEIGDVDDQVFARISDPATPDEQVADALRQLLADRPGVLALLAQG